MSDIPQNAVTRLLREVEQKTPGAVDQLVELVYAELKVIAASRLRGMPPWEQFQPTALVNEAYLKLFGRENLSWNDRQHFFSAASLVMRDIMIDRARKATSIKRGGKRPQELVNENATLIDESERFLELNEFIDMLGTSYERQAKIVEFKLFVGLSDDQIALALGISSATVRRDWSLARSWLSNKLKESET